MAELPAPSNLEDFRQHFLSIGIGTEVGLIFKEPLLSVIETVLATAGFTITHRREWLDQHDVAGQHFSLLLVDTKLLSDPFHPSLNQARWFIGVLGVPNNPTTENWKGEVLAPPFVPTLSQLFIKLLFQACSVGVPLETAK